MNDDVSSGRPRTGEAKAPKWSKERRQQFIDFRLQWDGRLNRSDLMAHFDISPQQASADISDYIALHAGNIAYDKSSKSYFATPEFEAAYPSSGPRQYLAQLLAVHQEAMPPHRSVLGFMPPTDTVPVPERAVDVATLKYLLHAIQAKQTVHVEYQSITRDEPRGRDISPHALVHDGLRWHVRAFCHLRQRFDDIVIGRVLQARPGGPSTVREADDLDWHRTVELVLVPHPDLTPAQRSGVELDFRMTRGRARLKCRGAMLYYTLRRLGLDSAGQPLPYPKQVVLANLKDLANELAILARH